MRCTTFSGAAAPCRLSAARRASSVVLRATKETSSRREAVLAVTTALALTAPGQAFAFLGFGEDVQKVYTDETTSLLADINRVIALEGEKETDVKALKKHMNDWTAKYRRNGAVGGRPSFGNMYSAINALAGHWNSFGPDAPVPKKRFARIVKELEDVDKLLARGR